MTRRTSPSGWRQTTVALSGATLRRSHRRPAVDVVTSSVTTGVANGGPPRYRADLPRTVPALSGHYPGYPIIPGVFLIELAAAAERLEGERHFAFHEKDSRRDDLTASPHLRDRRAQPRSVPTWTGIRSARFRAPVYAGQRIDLERAVGHTGARWLLCHGDGTSVATIELDLDLDQAEQGATRERISSAGTGCGGIEGVDSVLPEQILPHRPPMLLVDRVLQIEVGTSLSASYLVQPHAAGLRFPGAQVREPLPWPLVIESWAQAAAMLTTWAEPSPNVFGGSVLLFGGARGVRFGRPVHPGETLLHHVQMSMASPHASVLSGTSWIADTKVLDVEQITIGRRPAGSLPTPPDPLSTERTL